VSGRTRHLVVETQGLVLKVVVSAAAVQDRDGARRLAHAVHRYGPAWPRRSLGWAAAGYRGQLVDDLRAQMAWTLEGVKRSDQQPRRAFAVQPHRWSVARTFSGWGGLRRLRKDSDYHVESSQAFIYVGMSHRMLRRLCRRPSRPQPVSSPAG
jgi:putative transposase